MRRVPVVLHTLAVFCVLLSLLVAPATLLAQDPLPPCGIEHYDLTDPDWLAGNPGGAYLGNTNTAPDPCPPDIFLICNGIDTAAGHNGPDISSPPVSMWCGVPTFPPNKPGVNAGAACIGGDTRTVTLSTAGGDSFQINGSPGLGVVNGTSATFSGLQEGVGYQFQGIASNSSGSSGWSDPTPPVYHDLSAPVTTADVVGLGDGQMYRSEVSVALLANDTGCLGVVGTTYALDGVTSPYSGVFSVRGEGTHTLSFASTDGFHSEAAQTLTLFIDVTPPRTTLTQNGNTLRANATDNLSGVSVTMYRLNGGEMQGWFAALTLPGGNHRIEFASVDFAGNAEAWQTAYYSIPYGGGNVGSQGVDGPETGGAPVRGYPDWSLWEGGVPIFPTTPTIPYLDGRRGGGEMNPSERYTPAVMPYREGRRGGGSMNPPVRYVPAVEPERRGVGRGETVWADNAPIGVPSVVASIPAGMDDRVSKAIAALSLAATVGAGAFSLLEQKRQEQLERAKTNRAQNAAQRAAASQTVSVAATISDAEREYNRIKAERAALREQWLQAEAERLKAAEERRLKEEAARYAAYLAALRREEAARRANAARVRGAQMEADMMAAEEAEMADTARERQRQAAVRRRQQQQNRVEARASREESGWSAVTSTTSNRSGTSNVMIQDAPTGTFRRYGQSGGTVGFQSTTYQYTNASDNPTLFARMTQLSYNLSQLTEQTSMTALEIERGGYVNLDLVRADNVDGVVAGLQTDANEAFESFRVPLTIESAWHLAVSVTFRTLTGYDRSPTSVTTSDATALATGVTTAIGAAQGANQAIQTGGSWLVGAGGALRGGFVSFLLTNSVIAVGAELLDPIRDTNNQSLTPRQQEEIIVQNYIITEIAPVHYGEQIQSAQQLNTIAEEILVNGQAGVYGAVYLQNGQYGAIIVDVNGNVIYNELVNKNTAQQLIETFDAQGYAYPNSPTPEGADQTVVAITETVVHQVNSSATQVDVAGNPYPTGSQISHQQPPTVDDQTSYSDILQSGS